MASVLHRHHTRGHFDYGWMTTAHTFSFGQYDVPERRGFGALRVLNDDVLQGGRGFGAHEHKNMEIISIPLQGALVHSDNAGHTHVIRPNDVQVMSAGTGIVHSEYNHEAHATTSFLQLWILPAQQEVVPRYEQRTFSPPMWQNQVATLVAPAQCAGWLWIHQDARISRVSLEVGKTVNYPLSGPEHGLYVFVIEGRVDVEGTVLEKRDGYGMWEVNQASLTGVAPCEVLLIEVPMV